MMDLTDRIGRKLSKGATYDIVADGDNSIWNIRKWDGGAIRIFWKMCIYIS